MSAARIEQLKTLLLRVQERKDAPRVRSSASISDVGLSDELRRQSVVEARPKSAPDLRAVSVAATPPRTLDESAPIPLASVTPQPAARAPTPEPAAFVPTPAAGAAPAPVVAKKPELEVVPDLDDEDDDIEQVPAAQPITAPTARVDAPLLSRGEPVVKVVSSPQIEAPKTFGDLLEASLSLRPR